MATLIDSLKRFVLLIALRNAAVITEMLQTVICTIAFVLVVNVSQAQQVPVAAKPVTKTSTMKVLFDVGKSFFSQDFVCPLDSFCRKWKEEGDYRIYLYGNTDTIGRKSFNDSLSQMRVAGVAQFLQANGLKAEWIKQNSFGEEKPKYDDSLHQYLNRRVDVIIRYGLAKPKAEPVAATPVVREKKVEVKQVVPTEPVAQVMPDTVINVGPDFQIIMNKAVFETMEKTGTAMNPYTNVYTELSGLVLSQGNEELNLFPKSVTYRYRLAKEIDKETLDTLWYYDADKNGILKRVTGKVKLENKSDGTWLKFKSRWLPGAGDCHWWARLRKDMTNEIFAGNSFHIESPGFEIKSIKIEMDANYFKDVKYRKVVPGTGIMIKNYIGTNGFLDDEYTWEELSKKPLLLTLVDKSGKQYLVQKTLMELKYNEKEMKPELVEPKYHIHKEGCGHPGLTGGRIYFLRLKGNSTELATEKVIPATFFISAQDVMDLTTQVTK